VVTTFAIMRRFLKYALAVLALPMLASAALAICALPHTLPTKPLLGGTIERGTLQYSGRERTWIAYVPARLAEHPALVVALHGSMGTGEQVRKAYGYDFDELADRHGFVVVYPQGYRGHWNDCRTAAPYAARRENIDDTGFLHALVGKLVAQHALDATHVFVTGVSNGGSMTLCLALQTPDFARAYAAVVASVPAPANMKGTPKGQPVSVMLMNGTDDPIVPWNGGDVVFWPVLANRGPVLSAQASIDYFRGLAGLDAAPRTTPFDDRDTSDGSIVERALWSAPGKRQVALYTVRGGGHGVPHPATFGPRLLGHTNRDVHAAYEIWDFFQSAP
jgi:polyhydroxybutyrate depolymerase